MYEPLELLVIQASPRCNMECNYCYLPNRKDSTIIANDVLESIFSHIFQSQYVKEKLTILWHAGEPLAVPIDFYRKAIDLTNHFNKNKIEVIHAIQTNATLINQKWCNLIREHRIKIGVSIDGPAMIHDRQRVLHSGQPTHSKVMEGVQMLLDNQIPFYAICVLTDYSLNYPDEILSFFAENGFTHVGFNAEETEGINTCSTLEKSEAQEKFKAFFKKIFALSRSEKYSGLKIREFEQLHRQLFSKIFPIIKLGQQVTPFRIVSVDVKGNFYTWSPEFLDLDSSEYSNYIIGNFKDSNLENALENSVFLKMQADINQGVELCKKECSYFSTCGGGAPVNKICENQTFRSTETIYCKLRHKALLDVYVEELEKEVGLSPIKHPSFA